MNTLFYFRLLFALILNLLFFAGASLHAKVLFMTHCYNKPEFIPWQHAAFKKFMKEDYEFIVFNDAPNEQLSILVQNTCNGLGIKSIRVPQHIHQTPYLPREWWVGGASAECAETIQYMFDTVGFYTPGIVVVIDSDMFLIRDFKVTDFLKDHDIASYRQYKEGLHEMVEYLVPNLMFFNMEKLADKRTLNFGLGTIDGTRTDTGGFTHYYLKQHPQVKWLQPNGITTTKSFEQQVKSESIKQETIDYLKSKPKLFRLVSEMKYDYELFIDCSFLHFRAGSNWDSKSANELQEKTRLFLEAFDEILRS